MQASVTRRHQLFVASMGSDFPAVFCNVLNVAVFDSLSSASVHGAESFQRDKHVFSQEYHALYGTPRFITALTRGFHLSLS